MVGLGASAGGLEALEQFFHAVPADSGMAYVVVQHLDPSHSSLLTEILQRSTQIPVSEATDQIVVSSDHVYVIPPNRDMSIFQGVLHLTMPEEPRGQRMPIDGFMRGLAEDQGERAVGIILSGTGTDGTQGLRAIIGAGGISVVQDPKSAKYDSMPLSAIRAGFATHVLPPEEMPRVLTKTARELGLSEQAAHANELNRILALLRSATGHDFSKYKQSTIGRRIARRMSQKDIRQPGDYARFLKENPSELKVLFKELLINVTTFFRDREAFAVLKSEVLPALLADKPEPSVFRVWVAGCATGEEAYSIAILFSEIMDESQQDCKIQIYATDLDDDAITAARAGLYPLNIAQDVQPERLRRYFTKEEHGYRVKKELREMVVFAVQSVIKDPPFTKLDLLCCRNLMIYLEPELQERLIPTFHYALRTGGALFLSPSESIGDRTDLFTTLNRKWKLYRATPSASSRRTVLSSGIGWAVDAGGKMGDISPMRPKDSSILEMSKRMLLQAFAPASVVTDLQGGILFVHGDTAKYLRQPPGQATLNVIEMAREGLQLPLREAVRAAATEGRPTEGREVPIGDAGDIRVSWISVRPMPGADGSHKVLLISFQDAPSAAPTKVSPTKGASKAATNGRLAALELELAATKEHLQAALEEQQASNEELKSANEELQSTNEELQSTNEELETSKEELQSLNEELVTVNGELQNKIDEMFRMQNDMKNLLDNINVGTIFLDANLMIRRYTRDASKVFRLIDSDIGRALADIKSDVPDDDILNQAKAVLETLIPSEREVHSSDGKWYLIRIQPYRTVDNVIDGVVITFADITGRVEVAVQREARELAEQIVDSVHEPLLVLDAAMNVVSLNRSFCRRFGTSKPPAIGASIFALNGGQWDFPQMRNLIETVLSRDEKIEDVRIEHNFAEGGHLAMRLNARRVDGASGKSLLTVLSFVDFQTLP
ncbi:MAG: chemotaxis protein CheB [Usitatibacteraceae bacterium]